MLHALPANRQRSVVSLAGNPNYRAGLALCSGVPTAGIPTMLKNNLKTVNAVPK